nr:hypothetical protein [Tanacetum cinerariifolium]
MLGRLLKNQERPELDKILGIGSLNVGRYTFIKRCGPQLDHTYLGDCDWVCHYCGALLWYEERLKVLPKGGAPQYHRYTSSKTFVRITIMCSMTSLGAHVDGSINNEHGPYVFKVSGKEAYGICKGMHRDDYQILDMEFKVRLFGVIDGYGIDGFWLGFGALTGATTGSTTGATTGSEFSIGVSIWTTGGWKSLVLPLLVGGTVSFVTLVLRSTTFRGEEVVGIVGPLYAFPLRVVIPFKSSFGLVMVLLGRVLEPEDIASQLAVEESWHDEPELVLILIVSVLILIKPWWSEIIFRTIAKQITVTLRTFMRFLLIFAISASSAMISESEEDVIELDDSLR